MATRCESTVMSIFMNYSVGICCESENSFDDKFVGIFFFFFVKSRLSDVKSYICNGRIVLLKNDKDIEINYI